MDTSPWWQRIPPCPKCDKAHVLIDCTKRLPFEVSGSKETGHA